MQSERKNSRSVLFQLTSITENPGDRLRVGVNRQIVREEDNGLWAEFDDQWYDAIKKLALGSPLRSKRGAEGRKLVESKFSAKICAGKFTEAILSTRSKSKESH